VLPQLERGRRGDASGRRVRGQLRLEPDRGVDADEHVVAEHGVAEREPQQQAAVGEHVRDPAEAEAARLGASADDCDPAGLLPRRHDTGDSTYPSAAYAGIDAQVGVGAWNDVPGGEGATTDDGFTSYKAQVGNPPRTRWGDYGAASVDGNSIWIASEYIAHTCNYTDW